jgi:Lysylphosphatidylglycerol synthase TM region
MTGRLSGISAWRPSRRLHRSITIVVCAVGVVVAVLVARRLTSTSWPLEGARIELALAAAAAYLASFVFRALGWRQLFPATARPDRSRCLAACGAAAASGVVLPFRLDYVVKVTTLRRLGGVTLGLEAIAVSILSLGLVDAVAMLPLAVAAFATSGAIFRAPLAVVLLFCLGCIGVLTLGPKVGRLPLIARSSRLEGICNRVGGRAACTRATFNAGGFLVACWSTRALGNTLLLWALGVGFSPTFALVILCMAAAASILPITAGGAIVGVGATSGVLLALGVPMREAVNFSLASGLLLTSSALVAAVIGICGSILFTGNRHHLVRANSA